MKHNALTALSLAAALVVAGSAGATEFSIDFGDYAAAASFAAAARPSATTNAWNAPADDYSFVTNGANQQLVLDTGDNELIYTTTGTDVSILTMDVCFVAADDAPVIPNDFNGQTMVYLDSSGNLNAVTNGAWGQVLTGLQEGWATLTMTFDYTGKTVTFKVGNSESAAVPLATTPATAFTKVTSVGFKGTGMVDNFVGEAAPVAGPEAWTFDGTNSNKVEGVTVASGVVTTTFSDTDLKFIRYFNGESYVTLRYTNSQSEIDVGFDPTKIVAFYGNSVTATTGVTPTASAVAVDTTGQTPQISITVPNAVSGLYYTPFGPDGKALANSVVILPEADGDPATLSVPAATADWGVVKFQIVASDEAYQTNDPLQSNN